MPKELKTFINYVYTFYGAGVGIYKEDFEGGGCSVAEVITACEQYYNETRGTESWGGGDSIDRERVRTILQPEYSPVI